MSGTPARPLREDDIRPQHLDVDKEATYARDVQRLLARRDEFVEVPCPACGEREGEQVYGKHTLRYLACAECATVYISPRPSPAVLQDYYENSELYAYWNEHIFPASEQVRRERIFRPRVERLIGIVERHRPEATTLVEVGAGFGTFCDEARASGRFPTIVAVEPTPSLAQTIRDKGHTVFEAPIEEIDLSTFGPIDVLAAFEVLEHLFDPQELLRACRDALAPNGLLVLTCPNAHGFELDVLGEIADTIDTEHLNYFHPASLRLVCERVGLEVLEQSTPGVLDADIVRNKVLSGRFDLADQPFLRRVLVDEWEELGPPFQAFLTDNLLSTHQWIVARKPAASWP